MRKMMTMIIPGPAELPRFQVLFNLRLTFSLSRNRMPKGEKLDT